MDRCGWAQSALMIAYHDLEWGVPLHDDSLLFEFLILEGAQAGLSWSTILNRREGYRQAFDQFDPALVASYTPEKVDALLLDSRIIRNRRKIEAAVQNARIFLQIQAEQGSFFTFLWQFVDGKPLQNRWRSLAELPAQTPLSQKLSQELRGRGMNFVGPTICYAYMQAVGLVNDHLLSCFRHAELANS
ncbi:MAG: DNA-3-methyladenine glycosylase I [Anaerolineaceae bacterium]|nr:DNA-3-methyladenine glycosylase I [Anaerolineaceae bacterium]